MDETEMRDPKISRNQINFSNFDPDHLTELLSRRYSRVAIEPLAVRTRVSMSGTNMALPGVKLFNSSFAHGLRLMPQENYDGIFFLFPVEREIHSREGRGRISAAPGSAIASEGATCRLLHCVAGHRQHGVTIDRDFFAQRLSVLLGRTVPCDILFDPVLDARTGPYAALRAFLACLTSAEFGEALSDSSHTAARMPATIADFMLENWRHSYSPLLQREPPLIAPKHVKLALDLIADHPQRMPSVEDTARLCGVSLRALQYGFRRFVGTSITEYQRRARLERARSDLMTTSDSIEIVAHRWAFSNAGRFSRHFKAEYGISPSELRRD